MKTIESHGQEAWTVITPAVQAAVTVRGGMMAPVVFQLPGGTSVQPYYISPWQEEHAESIVPAVLVPLRGDFFCLPFGSDNRVSLGAAGSVPVVEDHQPHGESAWKAWTFVSCQTAASGDGPGQAAMKLSLSMNYEACKGSITKNIYIGKDQPYIATEHLLAGFSGAYPLGYHATLAGSTDRDGTWDISVPPFDIGMVDPSQNLPYSANEYHALKASAEFDNLGRVPSIWQDPATENLAVFPSRRGFVDIAAVYRKPRSGSVPWMERIGWTAAVNREEQYLWYSIKDAVLLPATVFWMENQGRHNQPWSGRNSCIGLEECCTYMAAGRGPSIRSNPVSARGIPTTIELSPDRALSVRTIQGVLPLPCMGLRIDRLSVDASGQGAFVCSNGDRLALPVALDWVTKT